MRTNTRRATAVLAATVLAFGLAGCGDDATGPDGSAEGHVSATVTDDPSSEQGSNAVTPRSGGVQFQTSSATFSGTMTTDATVQIRNSSGAWVDVGSTTAGSLTMQGDGQLVVGNDVTVDAGSYTAVRLTLDNAAMTIGAGSTIGGVTLDADILVDVGGSDGSVVIERQVTLDVDGSADARSSVFFDLNAESWVDETTVSSRTASDAEIQSEVTAYAMAETR